MERWSCENREDMQGPATRSRQRARTQDARDRALHELAVLMDVTVGERLRRRMHGLERRRAAAACRGYRGKSEGGEALQKSKAVMGSRAGAGWWFVVYRFWAAAYLHVLLACDGRDSEHHAAKLKRQRQADHHQETKRVQGIFEQSIRASLQLRGWAWLALSCALLCCKSTFRCSSLARLRQLACSTTCAARFTDTLPFTLRICHENNAGLVSNTRNFPFWRLIWPESNCLLLLCCC